ncbi:DUF6897 domain-containing protein [Clostridium sp.]|uniref:DUF6897 domain-containing protein n=1 Tax=Clostridium sp. TaxID=1506 RepID=UPI00262AB333|nr:hypothetical protein [uncultured Clostridium sp.]
MSSSWIAIGVPLFVVFLIVLPQQHKIKKLAILKRKKRKGLIIMTNELIKKYIGKKCSISTGDFGTNATGKIIDINENWIEVETKKGKELINAEFVQSIKITQ